jgi:hypothetical protein
MTLHAPVGPHVRAPSPPEVQWPKASNVRTIGSLLPECPQALVENPPRPVASSKTASCETISEDNPRIGVGLQADDEVFRRAMVGLEKAEEQEADQKRSICIKTVKYRARHPLGLRKGVAAAISISCGLNSRV